MTFFFFFFPLVFLWFILVSLTHCYEIIHLLWSHLHLIKPQPLQVGRAADMLNQAAYSCTHYFLWSHLQIIQPQTISSGWECSSYVESSCLFLHPLLSVDSPSYNQATVSLKVRSAVERLC